VDGGDDDDVLGEISNNEANFKILGEIHSFTAVAGTPNSTTSLGWKLFNNSDFLLPDIVEINSSGCYVYHFLDEDEGPTDEGQVHNFPSVHFKKNVSLPVDMSDYEITNASIQSLFNASVDINVDAPGDSVDFSAIWDSATFYVEIADLANSYSFRVAEYKTRTLGQNIGPILSMTDTLMQNVSENDLITAINLALEKDPDHSNFTIILGIDIYCEDNIGTGGGDEDRWNYLIIKTCDLTFSYQKRIDKFTSLSINQESNSISGENIQIINANINFNYSIDQAWPTNLSTFSEIRILINNNTYKDTLLLSSASTTYQPAKLGGFEVTSLIVKDVNITTSIQIFLANSFDLDKNITIFIDDVYFYISYIILKPEVNIFPLVIGLSTGIVVLITGFILYQVHFKYPKMVRKVKKLNKKIKKGKKLKPIELNTRDLIIKNNISKQKQFLIIEQEKSIEFKNFKEE